MNQDSQEIIKDMNRFFVGRMFGLTYVYLTRPTLHEFGFEGEKALRKGLRAFGKYRGKHMRKWHEAEGLPINLESTILFWDVSSIETCGCSGPGMIVEPYHLEFPATTCPLFDVNKEEKYEHYGYIYCDEIHQELWMAYDSSMMVEIHENLHKGDDHCWFKCRMEPGIPDEEIDKTAYKKLQQKILDQPLEYTRLYITRDTKLNSILYYFLADAIVTRFGDDGRRIVRNAVREIGRRRGTELRQKLMRSNLDTNWENILENFDLAFKYVWNLEVLNQTKSTYEARVHYCPFAEVWNELDNKEVGPMFCDGMYQGMFRVFNEKADIQIPMAQSRGDKTCEFVFKL